MRQVQDLTDLVELRLDLFLPFTPQDISRLMREFSFRIIFTVKTQRQTLQEIEDLCEVGPEFVDLESSGPPSFVEKIAARFPTIKIIISYHNFQETPSDLDSLWHSMQRTHAYLYKIALQANSSVDALRLLVWAKGKANLIPISMGEHGKISRMLSSALGSHFTYGTVGKNTTAPGQIIASTLIDLYQARPHASILGLIGNPVDKSISHETHNHLIKRCGLNAVYVKMVVTPEELPLFLSLAKKLPFKGLSVTMPLKEAILPFIDELDPAATAIGAVNTLLFSSNRIYGYNTDGVGALSALEQKISVHGKKVVLIGAGGAAKAIAYEAFRRGAHLHILNRDRSKAKALAYRVNGSSGGLDEMKREEGYDILINATPLALPIDPSYIKKETVVMDIVSHPHMTELLQAASEKGCCVIHGYEMFLEQAVRQFEIWFPNTVLPTHMRSILVESFSGKTVDHH